MKRIYSLIIISLLLLSNCETNTPKDSNITQRWRVMIDVEKEIKKLPDVEKKYYESLSEDLKEDTRESIKALSQDNIFHFKPDNTFDLLINGRLKQTGTWFMSPNGKALTLTNEAGEKEELSIKKLSRRHLIIKNAREEIIELEADTLAKK